MRSRAGVTAAVLVAALVFASGCAAAADDEAGRDAPARTATGGETAGRRDAGPPVLSVAAERALAGPDGPARDAAMNASASVLTDADRSSPRFLLFSTTDLWRQGGFAYGGMVWSPQGIDREGVALKLIFGGGLYRYVSGALGNAQVVGRQLSAAILPGWRFVRNGWIVTIFAGPEFQSHTLSPDDPSAGLRGQYVGGRAGFDLWVEPTAMSMVAADASFSTIGVSYSARLAAGWRVLNMFYLGPEVATFAADSNYHQYRAGLHITGLRTGAFEWSAGLGWATDSDKWGSVYGKLGVLTRR